MTTYSIGETLTGGYQIIDVKAGGMGVVYICHQSGTDQFYAIKTVKFQSGHDSAELQRRFSNEVFEWIKISRQRNHENVVQALLYNQDENWLFLEYVNGLPLHQAVPKGPAHMRHCVDWARGIACGMDSLHREFSYIHRDLKPQNVLVSRDGLCAKITDLGIGKVIQEGSSDHTLIGTPGYMAPESFQGQADFRTDIYSYGAVVYRLMTGEPPFGRGAPSFDRPPDPPSSKNPGIPKELDDLVLRCLDPSPKKRYQRFQDILNDIDLLPTIMDSAKSDKYRFCKAHSFFSPVLPHSTECLFCDHSSRHEELVEAATKASSQIADEVATIDLSGLRDADEEAVKPGAATSMETMTERGAAVADAGTLTEPGTDGTLTESGVAVAGSGGAGAVTPPSAIVQPSTGFGVKQALLVAGLLFVAGVVVVGAWKILDEKGTNPNDPRRNGVVGNGEAGDDDDDGSDVTPELITCAVEGCERRFEKAFLKHGEWDVEQDTCDDHYSCPDCGYHYAEEPKKCSVCRRTAEEAPVMIPCDGKECTGEFVRETFVHEGEEQEQQSCARNDHYVCVHCTKRIANRAPGSRQPCQVCGKRNGIYRISKARKDGLYEPPGSD